MSDLSTLSHEYESNALFAEEINNLVLKLKKYFLRASTVDTQEVIEAREKLADFIEGILLGLKAEILKDEVSKRVASEIPTEVIERLQEKFKNRMQYYLEDLRTVSDNLHSREKLDSKELELLDNLCDLSDGVASSSFRRLWRR
ncbi:MAG: hypothetical protein IBX72_14385 [Nitrospirae bacterium]|nr:hypothetical protein [Nitrospirota bacterium]